MTKIPVLPVDDWQDDGYPEADYETANLKVDELRQRVLDDPRGRAAYERASAEIDQHQATLAKLREARRLAQSVVAEAMNMQQSEISRLEHRTDFLLSTLRKFVEATGGELVLVARYPEGEVQIISPGESLDT